MLLNNIVNGSCADVTVHGTLDDHFHRGGSTRVRPRERLMIMLPPSRGAMIDTVDAVLMKQDMRVNRAEVNPWDTSLSNLEEMC